MGTIRIKSDTVAVVDDSAEVSKAISLLLATINLKTMVFADPEAFLRTDIADVGCVLLDVRMPEISGLEVFRRLRDEHACNTPIIFLTGHGEVGMAVKAMRSGAFDFLEKPVDDQILIDSVLEALKVDAERRAKTQQQLASKALRDRLTLRETEIANLLVEGLTSREVAAQLDLSVRTVEGYRSRLLAKLEITSLAKLVDLLRN